MCVTEFRRLCQASEFRYGEENRQKDIDSKNIEVKKGTYFYNGRSYYYATDRSKLKGLENYLGELK